MLVRFSPAADEWLPVPPEDLTMKDNPKQPGADAMVLYREVRVDAKQSSVNNYLRIKVFTQTGVKDQADIELPYDKADTSIQAVHGRTIRPDGTITEFDGKTFDKEIVKGSGIKYPAKTFTMPDVQPGCIIEYKYREQYDDRYYWSLGWTVQYDLYTRLASFSIKPDTSSYALPLEWRGYNLPPNMAVQKQGDLYTLDIHDLPGIDDEQLMPPPAALEAKVEFYYRDNDEPTSETPDQYWKRIGKKWSGDVDHFVDKKKELAAEVSQNVNASDTPDVKLRKLYARTLKIRDLDFEDSKSQKEAKQEQLKPNNNVADVLRQGYGNGLDINYLFLGLARAAGFDAEDVRVAPRNGMYFYPAREASKDLSAELVWVRAGSTEYYLDPSMHYYAFGVLPWFEAGASGVRVSKDGSTMILTPPPVSTAATVVRHADVNVSENMEMSGKVQIEYTGEHAAARRYDNRNEDESGRKKVLGDEIKEWLPVGSTFEVTNVSNWDDIEQPIRVEGTIKIPSFASGAVQRMLMPVEIFQTSEVGYFQSQKRTNEVDFARAYETIDDLVIHPPAGYKVQALPPAQKVDMGPVVYQISAAEQQGAVEVTRHLVIRGVRFPKESYPGLRTFFSAARTYDDAQVLFQSAPSAKNN
jgi:hypothetical protein